jgi:hypothetical protein
MSLKYRSHILFACLVWSVNVFAGNGAGNGGNGILCVTAQGKTLELLDFYEAKILQPNTKLNLGCVLRRGISKLKRISADMNPIADQIRADPRGTER